MPITVEFFGIARERFGSEQIEIEADNVGELIEQLAVLSPQLAEACFTGTQIRDGFILNINAQRFTRDPAEKLNSGDTVLLMSTDAGG